MYVFYQTIHRCYNLIISGQSVDKKDLNSQQLEIANDLELIQYDIIAGKGYLNNFSTFFKYKNRRII